MCMKHVAEDEAGQREDQIVESFVHVQCREVQFWSYSHKEPWKHAHSLLSIYHVLCSITVILFVRGNQSWCHHGSWLSLSFLWWKQWTMFACGGVGRKGWQINLLKSSVHVWGREAWIHLQLVSLSVWTFPVSLQCRLHLPSISVELSWHKGLLASWKSKRCLRLWSAPIFSSLSLECVARTLEYSKERKLTGMGAPGLPSPMKQDVKFPRGLVLPPSSEAHVMRVRTFWVLGRQILEIQMPGLYHSPALWSWGSHFTTVSFSSLISKTGISGNRSPAYCIAVQKSAMTLCSGYLLLHNNYSKT